MKTIYVDDPFFENHVASKPKDQQTSQYCLSQTLHVSQLWHYSGCLWWASSSLSAQALARGHLACWRAQTEGLDLDGLIIYTYSIHQGYIAYIHISLNIPAHNFEDMDIYIYISTWDKAVHVLVFNSAAKRSSTCWLFSISCLLTTENV